MSRLPRLLSLGLRNRKRVVEAMTERRRPRIAEIPAVSKAAGVTRAAVIGAGGMGRDQCSALTNIAGVELVGVADRDPAALARLDKYFSSNPARLYQDVAELLTTEKPDLVSIATTAPGHVPLACLAIESGIRRIVVEKPLSNSVAAGAALVEMSEQNGVRLAVDHGRRWSVDYAEVKAYIDRGHIGRVRQIYVTGGHGGIGMIGTHFFDLIRFLSEAEPRSIVGHLGRTTRADPRGPQFADPEGHVLLSMAGGVRAFVDLTSDLLRQDRLVVVQGERGRVIVDERNREWRASTSFSGNLCFPFRGTLTPGSLFAHCVRELLDVQASVRCGPRDGLAAMEMAVAACLSSERGAEPVNLPLAGADRDVEVGFA